jgi:hypothetical protein
MILVNGHSRVHVTGVDSWGLLVGVPFRLSLPEFRAIPRRSPEVSRTAYRFVSPETVE